MNGWDSSTGIHAEFSRHCSNACVQWCTPEIPPILEADGDALNKCSALSIAKWCFTYERWWLKYQRMMIQYDSIICTFMG